MPSEMQSSGTWAEQVEAETKPYEPPPREEFVKDGIKTVIEYKYTDGEKLKITSQYKITQKVVPKSVAARRLWKKFGASAEDPKGPNPTTTILCEEINVQYIRNRAGELETKTDDDSIRQLKDAKIVCRHCKSSDHWTNACPYKHMIEEQKAMLEAPSSTGGSNDQKIEAEEKMRTGTYVPPSLRGGGGVRPSSMGSTMDRRDDFTVRVTNLPEDTTDDDLKELFKTATGRITRIFLAKDKVTNRSKGFAFVTYQSKEDAERAILTISGHRYDHLILKVEWARPNVNQ